MSAGESQPTRTAHILALDDDELIRAWLPRPLVRAGHRVTCVATGVEARTLAREQAFDLAIVDIGLANQELNGIEVATALAHEHGLPFIFFTGILDRELIRAAALAGPRAYLGKPVDIDQLLAAVELALADGGIGRVERDRRYEHALAQQGLPPRQREVARLLAAMASDEIVAMSLGVSHNTARTWAYGVLRSLGLHRREDVAACGWRGRCQTAPRSRPGRQQTSSRRRPLLIPRASCRNAIASQGQWADSHAHLSVSVTSMLANMTDG